MTEMRPVSLAELQRAFVSLSSGVADDAATYVRGSAMLSPSAGMQIYADMFIWRQIDSLAEDFPKLAALTADGFYALCQAYLAAFPSRHHSLARLGCWLPRYLASRTDLRSDLSDLAALEWARCEVFEESTVPICSVLQIADVERALEINPALRILRLEHNVTKLWNAFEHGTCVPEPQRTVSCIVVWRKGFEVFHVSLEALEAEALTRAVAGESLSQVCETFADETDPIGAASRVIGSWCSEGWIAQGAT